MIYVAGKEKRLFMLFNPTVKEVRQFFISAWKKSQANSVLTPLEQVIEGIVREHPEYHEWLAHEEAEFRPASQGMQPPFLHLSLHLALQEQLSIDQPAGILACFQRLCKTYDPHQAQHRMMPVLADVIEEAKRTGAWPESGLYLDKLKHLE
jgi:Domain of unknown function (DUF1841)